MEPLPAGCLDAETRDGLARGTLAPADEAAAHAHLDACESCRRLVGLLAVTQGVGTPTARLRPAGRPVTPPAAAVDPAAQTTPAGAPEAGTPAAIGRFRIVDRLGAGGMGVVFRAFDPQLERQVALKVVRPEAGDAVGRDRLLREARAQARLAHSNVVAVHEVGELEGGLFLAMELVEGDTLRRWLAEPRPGQAIIDRFVAAGRGLAAAHAAGLVHRDFKPDNVLCASDGGVKVADFGLARRQEAADAEPPTTAAASAGAESRAGAITRTGAVLGTPAYMAPEQHLGRRADARSDQFAFAVGLWEALAGAHPFGGGRDARALAERVIEGRLDERSAGALPRRVRGALERALAVDPERRFPSMDDLLAVLGRPPWWRRRTLQLGAGAVAAAGAVAVVLLVASPRESAADRCRRAPDDLAGAWDEPTRDAVRRGLIGTGLPFAARTAAVVEARLDAYARDFGAMSLDVCEAHHVRHDQDEQAYRMRSNCLADTRRSLVAVTRLLSAADRDVVERASGIVSSLPAVDLCRGIEPMSSSERSVDRATEVRIAALRQELAASWADLFAARFERAHDRAAQAVAEADRLDTPALRAQALYLRGATEQAIGQLKQAEDSLFEAVAIAQAAGQDTLVADALARLLVVVGVSQRRFAEADRLVGLARGAVQRLGPAAPERLRFLRSLADLRQEQGRYPEALAAGREALQVAEELGEGDSVDAASVIGGMGIALETLGRLDEALEHHKRALAMRERVLGAEHPDVVRSLEGLAIVHCRMDRCSEGLPFIERALALVDRTLGPESQRRMTLLDTLGSVHLDLDHVREAETAYREAIALAEKRGWSDDPAVARSEGNLALIVRRSGRLADAEALHRSALERKRRTLGADHPAVAISLMNLAAVLRDRGAHQEELASLERAAALLEAAVGFGHDHTASALYGAAEAALALRRPALARTHATRALAAAQAAHGTDAPELADYRELLARVERVLRSGNDR